MSDWVMEVSNDGVTWHEWDRSPNPFRDMKAIPSQWKWFRTRQVEYEESPSDEELIGEAAFNTLLSRAEDSVRASAKCPDHGWQPLVVDDGELHCEACFKEGDDE